jgi:small subunit ribosomal protein S9
MADDDKTLDETPENTEETAEAADPAPVAEEQGTDETPVDGAAAEQTDDPVAEEPVAEEAAAEPVAEEAEEAEPEAVEEPPAAVEVESEVVEETVVEVELEPAEKKKDVIPGADLEPIAVEPETKLSAEEKARLEAEEEEKARREAALVGGDEPDADATSRAPAKMEAGSRFLATGKRKRSIARVTLLPGDGKVEINKRSLEEFFPRPLHQTMATQPLTVSGYEGNVDVRVRVHGGGISGQAGAVRHGIARALTEIDAELRGDLKRRGFLTRDARVKERRKAGFKKARKKPQFSKR